MVCVLGWGLPQADARPTRQKPNHLLDSVAKQPKKGIAGKKAKNTKLEQIPKPAMTPPVVVEKDGVAEARLMEIYRLTANANSKLALAQARQLVTDYPQFQLAQLVYADLMLGRTRPLRALGDAPPDVAQAGMANLQALRLESQRRVQALQSRPEVNAIPAQFVNLAKRNKHAIAVDTDKSRLYLFENTRSGPRLLADYYVSVGRAGVGKNTEGDLRTPLGVYFITSNLNPKKLEDLYGTGALPINFPNRLDQRRGKTGSGIWLHGKPKAQFARAPLATEGCIALSNPDLDRIIRSVEIQTTPVVIASQLRWTQPHAIEPQKQQFTQLLRQWADTKQMGTPSSFARFYADDFWADGKDLSAFMVASTPEISRINGRRVEVEDLSLIGWTDSEETMVTTFGEVVTGSKGGRTVRQYWQRRAGTWKIVYEGASG
jgi:murein L,D-transpeptidase YafK